MSEKTVKRVAHKSAGMKKTPTKKVITRRKKSSRGLAGRVAGLAVLGLLVIAYLAVAVYFMGHYFPGTVIAELDCSNMTVDAVRSQISARARQYTLTLSGRDAISDQITADDIDLKFNLDETLNDVLSSQNALGWIATLWKAGSHDVPIEIAYSDDKLTGRLESMAFFQEGASRTPTDAHIGDFDEEVGGFQVVEADLGSTLDMSRTKAAVKASIEKLESVLDLEVAGCYDDAGIVHSDDKMKSYADALNKYTQARIEYDWHGIPITVDGNMIKEWLITDEANGTVELNEAAVKDFVVTTSKKYDKFGSPRNFHTQKGEDITIQVVCYGWRVQRDKETAALIDDIKNGRQVSREPEYLYTAYNKGEDDIGNSYVEIDLYDQHLYLVMNGSVALESDFVSGNVSKGHSTPDGLYPLTYKERNATLRGQGYASPVSYWMPFNGNVGMHDASWRSSFGGSIFLRNGSHGCINLPKSSAEQIYGKVEKGFPVIVYGGEASKKRVAQDQPAPEPDPNDSEPVVDEQTLLLQQQMLLLQQQQLEELLRQQQLEQQQQQGDVPAQTDPANQTEGGEGQQEPAPEPQPDQDQITDPSLTNVPQL